MCFFVWIWHLSHAVWYRRLVSGILTSTSTWAQYRARYRYQYRCIPNRACERSWAVRISAPRSRGCSLPPLHRSKSPQTAPLNSAPPLAYNFIPASVKIDPRSLTFKIHLHAVYTLPFSTDALRLGHTAYDADVERVCCVTAAEKNRFSYVGPHLIRAYSAGSVAALIC